MESGIRGGVLPSAPPESVLAECREAAERMQELADQGGWVEFVRHPSNGQLFAFVIEADGHIGPALSPGETLELIAE